MDLSQAVRIALTCPSSIRLKRTYWTADVYVDDADLFYSDTSSAAGKRFEPRIDDLAAEDWIVFEKTEG